MSDLQSNYTPARRPDAVVLDLTADPTLECVPYEVVRRNDAVTLDLSLRPILPLVAEPTEHGAVAGPTANYVRVARKNAPILPMSPIPTLQLEVVEAIGAAGATRDRLVKLLEALNDYEIALGGAGIGCDWTDEPGRLTGQVYARNAEGAEERLTKLKRVITEAMPQVCIGGAV